MPRTVILRSRAEHDVRDIYLWYEAQRVGLGEEFVSELRVCLEGLGSHPESAPVVYRDVRRAIISKFPYLVFYVVEPKRVVVLAVLHSSRNAERWPRRRGQTPAR